MGGISIVACILIVPIRYLLNCSKHQRQISGNKGNTLIVILSNSSVIDICVAISVIHKVWRYRSADYNFEITGKGHYIISKILHEYINIYFIKFY